MKIQQGKIATDCSFPWEEKMIGNFFESCQHNKLQHFIYTNNGEKLLQKTTQHWMCRNLRESIRNASALMFQNKCK